VLKALLDTSLSDEFVDRFPDQLSGGERQSVAIARSPALEPRLLVCDEITSALDVSVRASIIDLLRRLQQTQHLTIVFITHNLPPVETIARRTAVVTESRIVETGPTTRVLRRPTSDDTARLRTDAPNILGCPQDPGPAAVTRSAKPAAAEFGRSR